MEDYVEMTTSSSDNSFAARSSGPLEVNMDLLPRYNPPRNRIASPSPSICSPCLSNGLHSRISDPNTTSQLGRKFGNTRLSNVVFNLEKMLNDKEWDYSDAYIVIDGNSVGVNRFVLASTCSFFHQLFSKQRAAGECKQKFYMSELVPAGMVGYEAFLLILEYLYTGNLKAYPHQVSTCIDDSCSHGICFPAIDFQLQLLYASATFQIDELVSSLQRQLLDILNEVATDDILRILSVANMCGKDCDRLLAKCIQLVVKSEVDLATLDKTLPQEIVKQIVDSHLEFSLDVPNGTNFPDEHVNRIHRALDSGDVKLVRMLLEKPHTSLVDAHALHYAIAFCDSKTTRELLDLSLADVNNRNSRGYTVLHVAARRKDPQIIVSLLTKGARPSDLTPDHRKALQIAKRATRAADYYKSTEGKPASNERLCIEVLEQAERGDPLPGDVSHALPLEGDGLRMKLLYLNIPNDWWLRMKLLYLNIPKDWWEHCTEDEFQSAFRMSKATFNFICEELNSSEMSMEDYEISKDISRLWENYRGQVSQRLCFTDKLIKLASEEKENQEKEFEQRAYDKLVTVAHKKTMVNALVRISGVLDKDREKLKLSNSGIHGDDRSLSIGIDGWTKTKRRRFGIKPDVSPNAVSNKLAYGYRELKQGMQHIPVADAHSRLINDMQTRENAYDDFNSASPTSSTKISAGVRAPRSGSGLVLKSSPAAQRATTPSDWDITSCSNKPPVVGGNNCKRSVSTRSSIPPVPHWAGQRPHKISRTARRTNSAPIVPNNEESPLAPIAMPVEKHGNVGTGKQLKSARSGLEKNERLKQDRPSAN